MIGIIIGCIVLVIVGWSIIKGKYAPLVLMTSGIVMLACSIFFDTGSFMPSKGVAQTGNDYLNIIEFLRYSFSKQAANLALIIMSMVGFASYMTHIGANDAFVRIAIKPLGFVKNYPYVMVFVGFMLCKLVSMVITSAVGLGVLCMALLGPALVAMGMNPLSLGAICATSGAVSMVLLGGSTAAAAEASSLSILDYVFLYKIPAGFPALIAMGIAHVYWQRYLDRKEGWICANHIGDTLVFDDKVASRSLDDKAPTWFGILPFMPMILVVLFSEYGIEGLKLHIIGVIFLSVIIGMLAETVHQRFNFDKVAEGAKVFFQAMGRSFGGVVILVIAAGIFADGFKALGMLSAIVNSAQSLGMGGLGMSIVFVLITVVVSIITGSNGASFYPIVSMIPTIAKSLNIPAVTLVLPMHQASTMARPLSPVAGVVVAIAGMLKVSPFEIVKRASVPCIVALIVNHIFVFLLA